MKILTEHGMPEYYIESAEELANIPENAPAGTIVLCNASDGLAVYMKNEAGEFNEL